MQKIAVQRNADLKPCRARKMLKNAPTLAVGGADPAENEPPKVRQVSNKIRRNIGLSTASLSRASRARKLPRSRSAPRQPRAGGRFFHHVTYSGLGRRSY